jgi:DNA-binding NarL/FixJ family response regulator
MKKNNRILIIEDELITANSIQELLIEEDYDIMGIATDANKALLICAQSTEPPAVAICDIRIKGTVNGITLAAQLKSLYGCEIIFLTAFSDAKTVENAFQQEPVMYVVKPFNDKQLRVAVQMAFHKIYRKLNLNLQLNLTSREKQIASMVAQGLSTKEIARQLNISDETVKTHRRKMLQKNDISSFTKLIFLMSREQNS